MILKREAIILDKSCLFGNCSVRYLNPEKGKYVKLKRLGKNCREKVMKTNGHEITLRLAQSIVMTTGIVMRVRSVINSTSRLALFTELTFVAVDLYPRRADEIALWHE